MKIETYTPINDTRCGWSHTANETSASFPRLTENTRADWVIIGAGFTGIAAAYRLAELKPDDSIILLDAEQAGAGASARNSGYIVDITLNDGGSSLSDDQTQLAKSRLNMAGLKLLKKRVKQHNIQCDWDESGKFHCAADSRNITKLQNFEKFLNRSEIPYKVWHQDQLKQRLGTSFYQYAVQTHKGVLVNPAALINGLLKNLPESVSVYEHSPVIKLQSGTSVQVTTPKGGIQADNAIIAVNALMPKLGLKQDRVFPLTLSASLSKPLSDIQFQRIGQPAPWGALSASSMGATVRLSNDRRILVRNTVEWCPSLTMNKHALAARRLRNQRGLRKRFPDLPDLEMEYTWSGNVCISRNSKPVFEKYEQHLFLAGCYNAGGIAMGSLFGKLIVDYALGYESTALTQVLKQEKPSFIPPRPLLDIGLQARLTWQRFQGRSEA